jgi:hypothetical protein
MRSALDASNALYPATVADWSNAALSSQDTPRDRQGEVTSFAEVFRVREAHGGEAGRSKVAERIVRRDPGTVLARGLASGSHIAINLSAGPRDPLKDASEAGIARPTSGVAGARGAVGGPEDSESRG